MSFCLHVLSATLDRKKQAMKNEIILDSRIVMRKILLN